MTGSNKETIDICLGSHAEFSTLEEGSSLAKHGVSSITTPDTLLCPLPALVEPLLTIRVRFGALSSQNINGVYIPSVLLLVGIAIIKLEWLPYAAIFASLVGGLKIFMSGILDSQSQRLLVAGTDCATT